MNTRTIQNEAIALTFGKNPLDIRRIIIRTTGQVIARAGVLSVLIRTPDRVSDPTFLTVVDSWTITDGVLSARLSDESDAFHVEYQMRPGDDGIVCRFTATGPGPLWMVEWQLTGFDCEEILLPALGGQALKRSMPAGTTLSYKYPFWWNAQFLAGMGRRGGIVLHTRDAGPQFKLTRVRREHDRFSLSLGFEVDGPFGPTTLTAQWALQGFAGSWKVAADRHRAWMEKALGVVPVQEHPSMPAWANDINFVFELWGMAKERPAALHTFAVMERRLREFARLHDPRHTLVYLPGFAEHGIDSAAPSYEPSPWLGGEKGFAALLETAHKLGFHVMIHTNVLCMTFNHPLFDTFREHQVVDIFGRLQGWGLDIDGDWLPEPYFAYINPGVRQWGDLMETVLGDLLKRFPIDGVFLDQTLLAFNTARGPNFQTGMRDHIERLCAAFPGTLFAGEGYHELVARVLPMAQIHGIDSVAEVHGLEGRAPWRTAHPISTYVFGPYTRFTAHLLTRHPSHPMFPLQEGAYARLGVIPALCLYDSTQQVDSPALRRMLRRARSL